MAVETGLSKQAYGITFTVRTADAADWATVANDTTFYDIDTDKVYYKDVAGTVKGIFDSGSAGEANTASNVGAGSGVFKQKTGVDLEFKTLTNGTGINLTAGTDEVEIEFDATVLDGDKGDITVSASGTAWTIDNDSVTYDKIQNVTNERILGNFSGSAGSVEELTLSNDLQVLLGVIGLNKTPMYISDITTVNLLDDVANWTAGNYTGAAITGTFQGQKHYNSTYFFECVHDNIWIRILRA